MQNADNQQGFCHGPAGLGLSPKALDHFDGIELRPALAAVGYFDF